MIEYLFGLLDAYLKGSAFLQAKQRTKSEVISKLRSALRATRKHIEDNRSGEFGAVEFSHVDSAELSEKWSEVAKIIRPLNPSLARTFEEKSDYWINTHGFRREIQEGKRRFDFRFRLNEVEKVLNELENSY